MITQSTYAITKAEMANKKWYVVDATDMVVGRLSSEVAKILRGKTKPTFSTNNDAGDYVIVVNAEKVKFTGKKWDEKIYNWHTNHIGGIKRRTAKVQLEKHPELIVFEAVKGMLPKNTLGRKQLTKLKVVIGPTHGHDAQKPEVLTLNL
ncbi:MAG TPA: 50S ribosomal protein L13 [Bacteriovoracaceae bacterium]|nr:50S ribosomal protein L13 [Bacteriovoracaceae bacterium]